MGGNVGLGRDRACDGDTDDGGFRHGLLWGIGLGPGVPLGKRRLFCGPRRGPSQRRKLAHERAALRMAGRDDLARKVRWVSEEDGDGAGYDIASFAPDGLPRLIEVKTTNGWERTPFHITRNELAVAEERRSEWRLFRLWNFSREPKAFELHPPLDAHVSLTATTFQASFH